MEFLILGPLEVRHGSNAAPLGSSKQRALLGVLLLHQNEIVSTARLVDGLWGERPPATAEKLVHGYVHALRKQLGDGVLETRPPGYRLRVDSSSIDLSEFERLVEEARTSPLSQAVELRRRALALWRGPPLADVEIEGSDRHAIARLSELRLTTQIEQLDAELALGRHTAVIGDLETLTAAHPYQERLAAQLMIALYRSGRQADALEFYRGLRRRLDEELGLQPGQELRDLEAAILRQDAELAAPVPVAVSPAEGAGAGGLEPDDAGAEGAPGLRARRWVRLLGALAAVVGVAGAAMAILARGDEVPFVASPNSVAVIDIDTNRVVDAVPVGVRPGPVAQGAGAVWVGNLEDQTLSRIDPGSRRVIKNIPLPATPDAIAVGRGAVWIVNARLGTLYRVDPGLDRVTDAVRLGDRAIFFTGAGLDVGPGSVWAAFGDSALARARPAPPRAAGLASAGTGPAAVVVAFGSVWVSSSGDATLRRFNPITFEEGPVDEFAVGAMPSGLAAGEGAIWVTSRGGDYVTRLDATGLGFSSARPIQVGDRPTVVDVGGGAVWVANSGEGSVSRIDPETNEVDATIPVGNVPSGIAVVDGFVWVSVQPP